MVSSTSTFHLRWVQHAKTHCELPVDASNNGRALMQKSSHRPGAGRAWC